MDVRTENVGSGGYGGGYGSAWGNDGILGIIALFSLFRNNLNSGNYNDANVYLSTIATQLGDIKGGINDVKYEAVSNLLNQTMSLMSEISNGRMENVSAILSQTNQLQSELFGIQSSIAETKYDLSTQMAACCCETNQNILTQGYESQLRTVDAVNTLARQQAECCCETQKLIQSTAFETQLRDLQNQCSTDRQMTEIKCLITDTAKDQELAALRRDSDRSFISNEINKSINTTVGHWAADRAFNGFKYPAPPYNGAWGW